MAHSILPPSSASVWGKKGGCTGHISMISQYPDLLDSVDAQEGEASHEIASIVINRASRAKPTMWTRFEGITAENGIPYTQEMYESAMIYARDVINVMKSTGVFGGDNFSNEKTISMPDIHELSFGTPDMWLFDKSKGVIYIWDYKFGHLVVDSFENWQMINYLSGISNQLKIDGSDDQHITVKIRIIQPRAYHAEGSIREWSTFLSDMRPYWNILNANAHEALSDNPVLHTGSHCKYCSARHVCTPALTAGISYFEYSNRPIPVELSPQALGIESMIINRAIESLKLLKTGYDQQIESLIKKGTLVNGFKVVKAKGSLKWNKPINEIIALGELLGIDFINPKTKLITPTAAKNLKVDEAVINMYSIRPDNGIKIVQDDGSKAREIFTNS